MSLLDSVAPLRFWWSKETVRWRSFVVVSSKLSGELVHRFLFITPKRIKTGMNVFLGEST